MTKLTFNEVHAVRTLPYTTNTEAVVKGLAVRGVEYNEEAGVYECTCCFSINEGHQDHCGTHLNEE